MAIGELLLAKNVIDEAQLKKVLDLQKTAGGRLGDNLVALGYIGREDLEAILQEPPAVAKTVAETGLDGNFLLNCLLRTMYISALQTIPEMSEQIKLTRGVIEQLLTFAKKEALVEIRGPSEQNVNVMRYALTNAGKERASEALRICEYIGPAPIPLESYQVQVQKQTITNEVISIEKLRKALSHLVLSDDITRRLGPASNSGRAILIYGAAGNGKTSIAEALAGAFEQPVYVPYCIEADGQIIKIFDPSVHTPFPVSADGSNGNGHPIFLPQMEHDPRWVRCRRPFLLTGGELTLEMLDLQFDPHSKYYEAPLQVKAIGGVFVIDDFGRQRVRPHELLNRWIYPLERKLDYLTLHTGKKFAVLFDQLVIFATNFPPEELMDPAQLRRVHYKMKINPPNAEEYRDIFQRICASYGLEFSEDIISHLLNTFYIKHKVPFAGFHPKFIAEHVIAACNYLGTPPRITRQLLADSLENMVILPASLSKE
ncbi:MAG: ATPase [Deltaproteobacteria bacterium]|nr:ATPase [Deltaproteobacteria bacterium]MDZ4342658.1 ATPase [Candidatus Binatia bacterium]